MIIYYHSTRDSALLLSLFTNLPSLHPLSFHEMNFMYIAMFFFHNVPSGVKKLCREGVIRESVDSLCT